MAVNSCPVSVVIPCFNAQPFLAEALESVFAQTLVPAEVIVVDDASTDGSAEIARSFGAKVRLVRCAKNSGYCTVPKDIGVHEAQHEFVAFLDADDVWLPRKLELQMPKFDDPAVGLVYGRAQNFVSGKPPHGPIWPDELPTGNAIREFYFRCYAPNSTVVARRTAILGAGGFDRSLDFCEDYDLWLRIAFAWRVDAVADVVMLYRNHPNQANQRRRSTQLRAQLALEERHADAVKAATGISETERRNRILQRLMGHLHSEFYNERNLAVARMYADLIEENFPDLDDETRSSVRKLRRRTAWPKFVFQVRDLVR